MKTTSFSIFVITLFGLFTNMPIASEQDGKTIKAFSSESSSEALTLEAKAIAKTFSSRLKPILKSAIQSGGFTSAVEVCSSAAPEIAKNLSLETGWSISRVSLQPRNQHSAVADPFEYEVLREFDERQLKGESAQLMHYSKIVNNEYRFMKAQGVEAICLNCHGKNISGELKQKIMTHYPDDAATGYSLGQIRGAISLTKILDK